MKLITAILAIYVLFLAAIPCCSFDPCEKETTKTENTDTKKNHSDTEKDCCNSCSPFFNCSDCGGIILPTPLKFTLTVVQIQAKTYTGFISPFYPDIVTSVWQPPQLA